jgi:hypothetical protein
MRRTVKAGKIREVPAQAKTVGWERFVKFEPFVVVEDCEDERRLAFQTFAAVYCSGVGEIFCRAGLIRNHFLEP